MWWQACTTLRELELGELDGMCHLAAGAPAPVVHCSQLAAFGHNKPFLRNLSLSSKVQPPTFPQCYPLVVIFATSELLPWGRA